MSDRALAIRVTGRVQGVGYRAWTEREARRLGVRGWVANHAAGHVDALFVGAGPALAELVALCRSGPPHAQVDHVDARSVDLNAALPPPDAYRF